MTAFFSASDQQLASAYDVPSAKAIAQKSTATETPLATTSAASAAAALKSQQDAYIQDRALRIDVETRAADGAIKEHKVGGFWDTFVSEPLATASRSFTETFGTTVPEITALRGELEAMIHGLFATDDVLAGLTSNIAKPDVLSLDRLLGTAAEGATAPIERILAPTAKDPLGTRTCARSVVTASLTTVVKTAAGAVSNLGRAVQAVGVTVGLVKNVAESLGPALMDLSVRDLAAIVSSQSTLCTQAAEIVRSLLRMLRSGTGALLSIRDLTPLGAVAAKLSSADAKLARIEAYLFVGAPFQQPAWDSAQRDVDEAAALLRNVELQINLNILAALPPMTWEALLSALEATLNILARQQRVRSLLASNLAAFESGFLKATRFDNLFTPVIDLIRCRIRLILEAVVAAGATALPTRLVQERLWYVELKAISAFMSFANKMQLPTAVNKFTGTTALRQATDAVVGAVDKVGRDVMEHDVRLLLVMGYSFLTMTRRAMSIQRRAPQAEAMGEAFLAEVQAFTGKSGAFGGLLDGFSGTVAATAATAVTYVAQIMQFAEGRGLTQFTTLLRSGDVTSAFAVNGLTASREGAMTVSAAQLRMAIPADKPVAAAKAEQLAVNYEDQARAVGLYDTVWNDSASRHVAEQLLVKKPALLDERRQLQEIQTEIGGAGSAGGSAPMEFSRPPSLRL